MKEKISLISLRTVRDSDGEFLFELLKERDPRANISHKKMPSYDEHIKFIKSKPYTRWYIILKSKERVGSIYLSKNDEIGIFLSKEYQKKNIGNTTLVELIRKNPRKRYLANVNPKNKKSSTFFKKNNFKLIQHTYEMVLE
jgi:RimJ/RimL family protein N-acetyltransferase|tara:strand:- start:1083 stop:1505 length:423 start_codon:yes stop_codon:yes gene_type:complete